MVIKDPAMGKYVIDWDYNGGKVFELTAEGKLIHNKGERSRDVNGLLNDVVQRLIGDLEGDHTIEEFNDKCQEIVEKMRNAQGAKALAAAAPKAPVKVPGNSQMQAIS